MTLKISEKLIFGLYIYDLKALKKIPIVSEILKFSINIFLEMTYFSLENVAFELKICHFEKRYLWRISISPKLLKTFRRAFRSCIYRP